MVVEPFCSCVGLAAKAPQPQKEVTRLTRFWRRFAAKWTTVAPTFRFASDLKIPGACFAGPVRWSTQAIRHETNRRSRGRTAGGRDGRRHIAGRAPERSPGLA